MNKQILTEFYSIGDKLAEVVWKKLLDLKLVEKDRYYNHSEMREILRKIADDLPIATQYDLKYNPLRRIPRSYIETVEKELLRIPDITIGVFGSYCRGKATSGDIDIVLNRKKGVFDYITKYINEHSDKIEFITPYQRGEDRIGFFIRSKEHGVYMKADIFMTLAKDRMFAELFATGSGQFNILMRTQAKRYGYLLNQYGLFDLKGKKIQVSSEKKLFELLKMNYREPGNR